MGGGGDPSDARYYVMQHLCIFRGGDFCPDAWWVAVGNWCIVVGVVGMYDLCFGLRFLCRF